MMRASQTMKTIGRHDVLETGVLLLLAVAVIFLAGCGKKGPPVAPDQVPVPVVLDLQAAVKGDTVTLTWRRLQQGETAGRRIAGYHVNRSKTPLAEAACLDCPILFQRVADIPTIVDEPEQAKKPQIVYSEPVDKGFRYIYMITVYTLSGTAGMDSNRVEFMH